MLFGVAAFILVVLTYYVLNWAVQDKDTIFDIHDLYYHYKFIDSWGDLSDTITIREELDNLKLSAKIYYIQSQNFCEENQNMSYSEEQKLVYWQNINELVSICDYINYQDSHNLKKLYGVNFPGHVSFGDIEINNQIYPATVIEKDAWRVLLIIDYIYPSEWITFLPIMLLTIIFMVVLYLIVRRFLKPISLMQTRIVALEGGDLDSSIDIIGEDELALLSKNFNSLILEIKTLLKQKERLLSDVSHEIRTPLSKMRLLLAMKPDKNKIKTMDAQIDYLDSMVTNILISDKLSAPYSTLDLEKIDIINLVKQAQDLSKHDHVKVDIKNPFVVCCDVVKMSIVIKNILDNALKYAPSDAGVTILASKKQDIITISCIDSGPGISEKLISKIDKPFVRGENLKKSGFGLGLSICKKILNSHGGNFIISNNKDKGACFSIEWNQRSILKQEKNAKKQFK